METYFPTLGSIPNKHKAVVITTIPPATILGDGQRKFIGLSTALIDTPFLESIEASICFSLVMSTLERNANGSTSSVNTLEDCLQT